MWLNKSDFFFGKREIPTALVVEIIRMSNMKEEEKFIYNFYKQVISKAHRSLRNKFSLSVTVEAVGTVAIGRP